MLQNIWVERETRTFLPYIKTTCAFVFSTWHILALACHKILLALHTCFAVTFNFTCLLHPVTGDQFYSIPNITLTVMFFVVVTDTATNKIG